MEENPRPRRGFQLGLRLLLILLAVVAGPLGWYAWKVERRAVDVLWTSGATIYFV